ncbi:MAG: hypothetical protein JNK02_08145 [Planctomycetes bacterium]|nr:hypothetical protein [Planctomycetota bacterium]
MAAMIGSALLLVAVIGADGLTVRASGSDIVVDAERVGVEPIEVARALAAGAGLVLRGEDLLAGRPRVDLDLSGRPLREVLGYLALATRTLVDVDAQAITFLPARDPTDVEELILDAEAAWIALIREFPSTEAARVARVELGRAQELRGHEDAALVHYEIAAGDASESPASLDALAAAAELMIRRGEWAGALHKLSRLAQGSSEEAEQIRARLGIARCLAEQGRGTEALALLEVVDVSYPVRGPTDVAARALARTRALLAAGRPADALHELDRRAGIDPRHGERSEDLGLRARALQELNAPLEAARAWLACSTAAKGAERDDALASAARLAAAGGDDLAVLFVERLARGGGRHEEIALAADRARVRLGLAALELDLPRLEQRWSARARVGSKERAQLARDLVRALAREHGAAAAASLARAAIEELPAGDARTVRTALAVAYENEGAWEQAALVWGGAQP